MCSLCGTWYFCCFSLELVTELDQVLAQLQESNDRIVYMNEEFSTARRSLEAENIRLLDEVEKLNDKYNRFSIIVSLLCGLLLTAYKMWHLYSFCVGPFLGCCI